MSKESKTRIIELQKSLRIAREALEKIKWGHAHPNSATVAADALDEMFRLEQKQQLQGLCGHERPKLGGEGRR